MSFDKPATGAALADLAARKIFVGTSSWKYEGWLGQLYTPERYEYRGKVAKSRFEADCLEEYAQIFPTVCVDAGFYRFPNEQYIAKLARQVPEDFQFSFKVTDEITVKQFPNLPRHGERAEQENKNFLNAGLFVNEFLGPISPYRKKIGVLMFQFSQFYPRDFERGREFIALLDEFLGKLPHGWRYGVEIRNKGFLKPDYFETLTSHNVAHVFNSWSRVPDVTEQMAMEGSFTPDFVASRFLLKPGRSYENAVKSFSPYASLKEPYPAAREAMKGLLKRRTERGNFIYVNNRLEGNALETIAALS